MIESEEEARSYCLATLGPPAVRRLERFAVMLAAENSHQNLVATASLDHIWRRHIADSVQLLEHVPRETPAWLDLGSGAGPPGLLVAMARPDWPVHLVEVRRRRAEWLRAVVETLGLQNCTVLAQRVERVPTFDAHVISARAFAPLGRLLALAGRFSTPDTVWLLPKGRSAAKELEEQEPRIRAMFHVKPSITDMDAGLLIGHGRPPGA